MPWQIVNQIQLARLVLGLPPIPHERAEASARALQISSQGQTLAHVKELGSILGPNSWEKHHEDNSRAVVLYRKRQKTLAKTNQAKQIQRRTGMDAETEAAPKKKSKYTRSYSNFAKDYNPGVHGGSQIKTQVSLCVDYLGRILRPEDFQGLHNIADISWMNEKRSIGGVGRFSFFYPELPSCGVRNLEFIPRAKENNMPHVLSWDVTHRALLDDAMKSRREASIAGSRPLANKQGEIIYKEM
jgi:hypothetical protein